MNMRGNWGNVIQLGDSGGGGTRTRVQKCQSKGLYMLRPSLFYPYGPLGPEP